MKAATTRERRRRTAPRATLSPTRHKANDLDDAENSEPPPRHSTLHRALRKPPEPPSGAATPTCHRSRSSCNAARPSHPQSELPRATTRRPRPPHHIRGRCLDVLKIAPCWDASTEPTTSPPLWHEAATHTMPSRNPTTLGHRRTAIRGHRPRHARTLSKPPPRRPRTRRCGKLE